MIYGKTKNVPVRTPFSSETFNNNSIDFYMNYLHMHLDTLDERKVICNIVLGYFTNMSTKYPKNGQLFVELYVI